MIDPSSIESLKHGENHINPNFCPPSSCAAYRNSIHYPSLFEKLPQ